jgi:hypothetical protein
MVVFCLISIQTAPYHVWFYVRMQKLLASVWNDIKMWNALM